MGTAEENKASVLFLSKLFLSLLVISFSVDDSSEVVSSFSGLHLRYVIILQ